MTVVDAQDQQRAIGPTADSPYGIPIRGRSPGAAVWEHPVSERTPLLRQPSPLIPTLHGSQDDGEHDEAPGEQVIISKMFHEELRILPLYSLPILCTHLAEYSFVIASVISIGHISTLALASATLASMTASVTGYSIVQGFASALDTLLPPAWTSDRPYMVGLWTQRMVFMMGMILIPILATWLNAESILLALNQESDVARLASVYLRWASLGLPAYAFNCISRRYFQSQGLFNVPARITLVVAPINAFLNWLFVYPLGLSFLGAPLATALSFNLVSVASIFYGYYYTPPTAWSPITCLSLNPILGEIWKGWGLLARLGTAGVGQTASAWWSWELVGLAASQMGPVALASQSILLLSGSFTYQVPFSLSVAASVRIGNLLGQGNSARAEVVVKSSIIISIAMGCIFSISFWVSRHNLSYLFNNDPEVASTVASIIPLIALYQLFDGTTVIIGGIFRARGKQALGAILNLSAYYMVGIPLGLYLAFVRHHALEGLWEGLTVALLYIFIVGLCVGVRGVDWNEEAVDAQGRIGGKAVGEEASL